MTGAAGSVSNEALDTDKHVTFYTNVMLHLTHDTAETVQHSERSHSYLILSLQAPGGTTESHWQPKMYLRSHLSGGQLTLEP